jgi:uncharacterized membrane-anchored protein
MKKNKLLFITTIVLMVLTFGFSSCNNTKKQDEKSIDQSLIYGKW